MSNLSYLIILIAVVVCCFIIFTLYTHYSNKRKREKSKQLKKQVPVEEKKEIVDIKKPIEWVDLAINKIEKLKNVEDLSNLNNNNNKDNKISQEQLFLEVDEKGGSGKILVVDDALVVRKKITNLLAHEDFAFVAQKDGQYAINYLEHVLENELELPDVIVTDLEMPNVDGIELISWVRNNKQLKGLPIIVVSSHMNLEKLFSSHNIQGFLPKPFKDSVLIEQIDYLIKS